LNAENTTCNLSFGFIQIVADVEERPQCLLWKKILASDSIKLNKLQKHLKMVQAKCVEIAPYVFHNTSICKITLTTKNC